VLQDGTLDPDDPRTITVSWCKHLLKTSQPQGALL
jgi:hypothetical protein